jgi:hypothetical protein
MGTNPDGTPHVRVEAMSLTELGDDDFATFYELAMAYICEKIIPGMSREDLERDPRKL